MTDWELVHANESTTKAPTAKGTLDLNRPLPSMAGQADGSMVDRLNGARRSADTAHDFADGLNSSLVALAEQMNALSKQLLALTKRKDAGARDDADKLKPTIEAVLGRINAIANDYRPTSTNGSKKPQNSLVQDGMDKATRAAAYLGKWMDSVATKLGAKYPEKTAVVVAMKSLARDVGIGISIADDPKAIEGAVNIANEVHVPAGATAKAITKHFANAIPLVKQLTGHMATQQHDDAFVACLADVEEILGLVLTLDKKDLVQFTQQAIDLEHDSRPLNHTNDQRIYTVASHIKDHF